MLALHLLQVVSQKRYPSSMLVMAAFAGIPLSPRRQATKSAMGMTVIPLSFERLHFWPRLESR